MNRLVLFLFTSCIWMAGCSSQEKKQSSQTPTWVQLFNGEDLEGWDIKIKGYDLNDNFGNTFQVDSGMIKVSYEAYDSFDERFGHLFYKVPFSKYKLRVEYRFVGDQAMNGPGWALRNSGVMFHSQSAVSMMKDQDFPVSLEAQFLGGNGADPRSTLNLCTPGTHVNMGDTLVKDHCINSTSDTFHGPQWVMAELHVFGDSLVRHFVNDVLVMEYTKPVYGGGVVNDFDPLQKKDGESLMAGHIALQSESHPIHFRKVEILDLSK